MPFRLGLPQRATTRGWKVKIRDKERLEPPHVTIELRRASWRVNLRSGEMMDRGDTWSQIDSEVADAVRASWVVLRRVWDEMYPSNPVGADDDEPQRDPPR